MPLIDLRSVPESVAPTMELVSRLDEAFESGFGRLTGGQLEALGSLARCFQGTPLHAALAEAVAGLSRSEFLDRHFAALAAARSAAYGAVHDALVAQASAALGRARAELEVIAPGPVQAAPPKVAVLLESVRQWLMELAIAGFANLEVGSLLPFQATLDAIMGEPALVRHAALLSGFLGELLTVFPAHGTPEVPRLRWTDLWARAMVLSLAPPEPIAARAVSGELRPFASDLRQHDNLACLVVYAALHEPGKPARAVRTSLSAFKVDVLQGEDLGPLLAEVGAKLLAALAGGQGLKLAGVPLLATGDLVWDDAKATLLPAKVKPAEEAAAALGGGRPCLAPADRHPALLEELVHLAGDGYAFSKDGRALTIGGKTFPLAIERWPVSEDLTAANLAGSKAMVGLLRFDGGEWSLQPVMIDTAKGARMIGTGLAAAKKAKDSNLATLKERASKLLRKKS